MGIDNIERSVAPPIDWFERLCTGVTRYSEDDANSPLTHGIVLFILPVRSSLAVA